MQKKLTFDAKPKIPDAECERRDSVPLATPMPTRDGFCGN